MNTPKQDLRNIILKVKVIGVVICCVNWFLCTLLLRITIFVWYKSYTYQAFQSLIKDKLLSTTITTSTISSKSVDHSSLNMNILSKVTLLSLLLATDNAVGATTPVCPQLLGDQMIWSMSLRSWCAVCFSTSSLGVSCDQRGLKSPSCVTDDYNQDGSNSPSCVGKSISGYRSEPRTFWLMTTFDLSCSTKRIVKSK